MPGIDTSMYAQSQPNAFLGTANEAAALRGQQIANQTNQQAQVTQQVKYLAGGLGILAQKPDLSQADMLGFAQNALKEGIISPQTYQVETQNVQAAGENPAALQALARNYSQRALDAGAQFQTTYGTPDTVQTGSNTIVGNRNAFTGNVVPAGSFQQGMGPSDANSMVIVTNPDGSTQQVTKAQSVQMMNPNGNALTQQAPAQPQAPTNALTGSTFAPPGTGVPLAPQSPGIRAPSPQEQGMFKASADQYQMAKQNASTYAAQLTPIQNALQLLDKTPLVGKGSEIPTDIANMLNTFGVKIGTDQAQNYAELNKYLTQIARSSGAAPNSIPQLEAAQGANPNVDMNKAPIGDVLKTMTSLMRMNVAAPIVAQQAGMDKTPEGYSNFAQNWGKMDPRAFGVDLMTPEAKAALLKELNSNPADKAKFMTSLRAADSAGVLGAGGGQ